MLLGLASHTRTLSKLPIYAKACTAGILVLAISFALGGCSEANNNDSSSNTQDPQQMQEIEEALATLNDLTSDVSSTQEALPKAPEAQADATFTPEQPQNSGAVAEYAHYRTPEERTALSDSLNDQIPEEHVVFLTFDDGPSPNTYRILDILNNYGVKATWFVKAINEPYMPYLQDIWAQGNQVAIHTYSHEYYEIYASPESYWADVQLASDLIYEQIGVAPTLVRFPGGSVNDYNREWRSTILSQYPEYGYHYFDWNVSCGDGMDHAADELVYYTLSEADGCHSCCVLMHDSGAKDTTVEALPQIIEYFISQGFVFDVLLSDTFGYHF